MAAFTRIREKVEDMKLASPVLISILQLLIVTLGILNFMGGIW